MQNNYEHKVESAQMESSGVFTIEQLMARVQNEPPEQMIYPGIKQSSVGFVFGPSKSGKTMFCENLGMLIATGASEFLGKEIGLRGAKVLFISLEEFYTARTERNKQQISRLQRDAGGSKGNFLVVDDTLPRYIVTNEEWELLHDKIADSQPHVVFIDSLSRLYSGSIEDSAVAQEVMRKLRGLANSTNITLIVIHHTAKLYGRPLTMDTLAGSRILAQEADFLIGVSRTFDNRRYIKEVAFRYCQENDESVQVFSIGKDCWLNLEGEETEMQLIAGSDGRRTDSIRNDLYNFIKSQSNLSGTVSITRIRTEFPGARLLSKVSLNKNLDKLIKAQKIERASRGLYRLISK